MATHSSRHRCISLVRIVRTNMFKLWSLSGQCAEIMTREFKDALLLLLLLLRVLGELLLRHMLELGGLEIFWMTDERSSSSNHKKKGFLNFIWGLRWTLTNVYLSFKSCCCRNVELFIVGSVLLIGWDLSSLELDCLIFARHFAHSATPEDGRRLFRNVARNQTIQFKTRQIPSSCCRCCHCRSCYCSCCGCSCWLLRYWKNTEYRYRKKIPIISIYRYFSAMGIH